MGWSLGGSVLQSMLIRHARVLSRAVLLNAFPSYTPVQDAWLDTGLALRRAASTRWPSGSRHAVGVHARLLADHAAPPPRPSWRADPHPTTLAGFEAQAAGLRVYDSRPDLPRRRPRRSCLPARRTC